MADFIIRKQCEMKDLIKIHKIFYKSCILLNYASEKLKIIFGTHQNHDLKESELKIYFEWKIYQGKKAR